MNNALHPAPLDLDGGNPRPVLQAAADAARAGRPAALAVVLQTEGSSYSRAGTCALFEPGRQVGWLSGGCLEPELARQGSATRARRQRVRLRWGRRVGRWSHVW